MLKNGPGNRVGDRPWTTQRGTDAAPPTHTGAAFERGDVHRQHSVERLPDVDSVDTQLDEEVWR